MWPPPPEIPSLPAGKARPFWSVMIPFYNGTNFLGEALRSVLAQDPGTEHMQIAVVDDASTDNPQEVIRSLAGTRVEYYRNPSNLGAPENLNQCLRLARGHWVHLLHQDDCVREGFYATFQQAIGQTPNLVAAFCRVLFIDEAGNWRGVSDLDLPTAQIYPNFATVELISNRIWTAGIVVSRRTYEQIGGYRPQITYAFDWEMWIRLARSGPVWFDPTPLACYRHHGSSITARTFHQALIISSCRAVVRLVETYLNPEEKLLLNRTRKTIAEIGLASAREALEAKQMKAAGAFFRETLLTYPHPFTFLNALFTFLAFLVRRLIRPQHKL